MGLRMLSIMTAVAWPSATASRAVSILILGKVVDVVAIVGGDVVGRLVAPLFQVDALVLQRVGQLVGKDRLLLVDGSPSRAG